MENIRTFYRKLQLNVLEFIYLIYLNDYYLWLPFDLKQCISKFGFL